MNVESYLVKETQELVVDAKSLDKWKAQCEKLEMEGQLSLVNKKDASPIPFRTMTVQENHVYEVLLPQRDSYREYDKQPIPLEVLSLIALAEKENYFKEIQIWSDYDQPDPVVVGIVYPDDSTWNKTRYIIARWGEELDSMVILVKKAIAKEKAKRTAQLKDKITKCTAQLENIEDQLESHFNGNRVYWEV